MDDKFLDFPCTKQCLVYACCNLPCDPYKNYVQEAFTSRKYGCFKIIPEPPQQIQELAEILNRVEGDKYMFSYYTASDVALISYKTPPSLCSVIAKIRKETTLKYHKDFPEDFR